MEDIMFLEYLGHKYVIARIHNDVGWLTDYDREFYSYDSEGRHQRTLSEFRLQDFHWTQQGDLSLAATRARTYITAKVNEETEEAEDLMDQIDQSIHEDKDDGQYEILYEGFHGGHKYMVVKDKASRQIGFSTDLDQDLESPAPAFNDFDYFEIDSEAEAIKLARRRIDLFLQAGDKYSAANNEVSMGVQEEREVIEAKRVMSWAIIKLTKSIEDLRELCKRKNWDDEITYDMEEAKIKLGECLADLTVWDEESFEKGSTHA